MKLTLKQLNFLIDRIRIRKNNQIADEREFQAALKGAKIKIPKIKIESEHKFKVDKSDVKSKMSDDKAMQMLKDSLSQRRKEKGFE